MLDEILREGFALANRRLGRVLLDTVWKAIWLAVTAGLFVLLISWYGSRLQTIAWEDTGVPAVNAVLAATLLREFWDANKGQLYWGLGVVIVASGLAWFFLEAFFRSRYVVAGFKVSPPLRGGVDARSKKWSEATALRADGVAPFIERHHSVRAASEGDDFSDGAATRPQRGGEGSFRVFLASAALRFFVLAASAFVLALISAGPFLTAPFAEWPGRWLDTRGAVVAALVAFLSLAFLVTLLDTLVRGDAIDLLGKDLIRVSLMLGILMLFEAMAAASVAAAVLAGFLNVGRMGEAIAMLGAAGVGVVFLSLLHSYLLLVRFSAVDIMRRNVVEI